jgi:ATP/maltotriose-dependent transcriptional regulator MalT
MGAAVATASLGYQEALEGNSQEAATLLQKAFAAFEGIPDSYRSWFVRTVMAAVGLLEGRPRAGRVLLEPLRAFAEAQPSETAFLLCTLVEARLKAGEVSGAEELATRTVKAAATAHNRPLFAEALWIQAMVRVVQGRTDEAARLFEASVTLARSMPYPLLQGRILLAWGSMGREADTDRARLEQARDIFTRLGAAVYAARTQEALLARQA